MFIFFYILLQQKHTLPHLAQGHATTSTSPQSAATCDDSVTVRSDMRRQNNPISWLYVFAGAIVKVSCLSFHLCEGVVSLMCP